MHNIQAKSSCHWWDYANPIFASKTLDFTWFSVEWYQLFDKAVKKDFVISDKNVALTDLSYS